MEEGLNLVLRPGPTPDPFWMWRKFGDVATKALEAYRNWKDRRNNPPPPPPRRHRHLRLPPPPLERNLLALGRAAGITGVDRPRVPAVPPPAPKPIFFPYITFVCVVLIFMLTGAILTVSSRDDIVPCTAESLYSELGGLDSLDTNEIEEIDGFKMLSWSGKHSVVNVDDFGAVGDGISDDTLAFSRAWTNKACSTRESLLLVPKAGRYLVNATIFNGPSVDKLIIKIDGPIVAPSEIKSWDPELARFWLGFNNLTRVLFKGKGVLDGSGSTCWAASCKRNKSNPCTKAPKAFSIDNSSAIYIRDLTLKNSQQFHFTIARSHSVHVSNVLVTAPADSPNTDGIHILNSTKVVLKKCKIATGDDCISIIAGNSNIKMKSIDCGPGHGISIGSLGKDNATDFVHKIHLNGALFRNTTNGLRIKSWQGGSGYAKEIKFEKVIMEGVKNPIIIDQFYCDSTTPCANQVAV